LTHSTTSFSAHVASVPPVTTARYTTITGEFAYE